MSPAINQQGWVQTWVTSQWKNPSIPGQFSAEINRRAQVSVFQRFRSHFADLQLRPVEFSILTLIQHNPGRKQTEIAQALDIKRANFVPIIDGLEGRGLLERRRSLDDRRANALYLTLEGEKFVTSLRKRHEALERFFTSRLGGESEREQLLTLLLRLL